MSSSARADRGAWSPAPGVAIEASGLSKRYAIGGVGRYPTLRDTIAAAFGKGRGPSRRAESEPFWALRDVSFTVAEGEVAGIIGRNGAGKSTLLRVLARITEPSAGRAAINGRLGSLLEVGTGFHPELTGRENVFLNGAILGMTRAEIARKFDEIVAFADVGRFLDTPVKHYSSGMFVRLAFAVAAHLETEILLVDEVLAVGDAAFQAKCLGKMRDVASAGRTVLLVSHNMAALAKLCPRSLLLAEGRLAFFGDTAEAIQRHLGQSDAPADLAAARRRAPASTVSILAAHLEREGAAGDCFLFGDRPAVVIRLAAQHEQRCSIELLLRDAQGLPVAFAPSGLAQDIELDLAAGEASVRCLLPRIELAEGRYSLDLAVAESGIRFLDYLESALAFTVGPTHIGSRSWTFRQARGQGCMLWRIEVGIDRAAAAPAAGLEGPDDAGG